MSSRFDKLSKDLATLVFRGELLYYSMAEAVGKLSEEAKKTFADQKIKLPELESEYDTWYSEALRVVSQLIPDRRDDFIKQYKNEKRKNLDYSTYTISDYLIGLRTTRGGYDVVVDRTAALPRMQNQVSILKSASARFTSQLFDIREVLQADIFDSELEAARELAKKGFVRGAGAVAGVVLEAHLGHVVDQHGIKTPKKNPSISDFNQLLKDNDVIDTPQWRSIQHLGDIRNLCDHKKDREPSKEELTDLVNGVDKIIKTVF